MPKNAEEEFDDAEGDDPPKLTLWERVRYTVVTPDDPDSPPKRKETAPARPLAEVQADIARTNDKERAIGLIAAPVGAIIGIINSGNLIDHAKSLNESTSVYVELTWVLMALAVVILAMAWFRKRLLLGMATGLLGLDLFNLHGYGFAIPFLMAGAWYLVRAYRLQKELKLAGGGTRKSYGPPTSNGRLPSAGGVLPRPNKRYTPPTAKTRRPFRPKSGS